MGYHTDLLYTYGYYREINPLYAKFIFNTSGLAFPDITNANACELGFGQGVSINMHAAGSNINWYGTDFNPSQVNFARHLAKVGNINVKLADDAFGDFAQRQDLPMFDFICLHGIWSWISRENQDYIVDFVKSHLNVGGVLYISYNVSPGFMTFEPVRYLMAQFNQSKLPVQMDYQTRFKEIGQYLEGLMNINPGTLSANPTLLKRTQDVLTKDGHYLSGEYLNTYWDIIHFSDMAQTLDRAKLSYACSATGTEHLDNINLTAEQQAFLAPFKGTNLYEDTRDFIVYQQFRRDFFQKGKVELTSEQKHAALSETYLVLNMPKDKFSYSTKTRLGTANLRKEVYQPIFEAMGDYQPHCYTTLLEQLIENKDGSLRTEANLDEALRTLVYIGAIAPSVNPEHVTPEILERCHKLNRDIVSNKEIAAINVLVSPLMQGGIGVGDVSRKLLDIYLNKPNCNEKYLLDTLFEQLKTTGSNLNKNGQPVTDPAEQKKLLKDYVHDFMHDSLPLYKGLMLI